MSHYIPILVRAIMEVTGRNESAVRAMLDGCSKQDAVDLRYAPKVAPIVDRMIAEAHALDGRCTYQQN